MIKYKKKIVRVPKNPDKMFILKGIFSIGRSEKILPRSTYKGYPGGWAIPRAKETVTNSEESSK